MATSNARPEIVARLADLIAARRPERVLRVAIDGPDAAGKTTLAGELAAAITGRGRPVIRVGIDGFHRPRAIRQQRGPLSAEGYFLDSFDYAALRHYVLDPLGPGGDGRYKAAVFDFRTDTPHDQPFEQAASNAVLLMDGVFLLRGDLRSSWDLTVYVEVSPQESVRRALERDLPLFGSREVVEDRYRHRYLPGQELYRSTAHPVDAADVVISNEDPAGPTIVKWPAGGTLPTWNSARSDEPD